MKDKLDEVLRNWSNGKELEATHLRILEERICREILGRKFLRLGDPAEGEGAFKFWDRFLFAGLGAAAACLLFLLLHYLFASTPCEPMESGGVELAAIPELQVQHDAVFFQEARQLFAEALHWIVSSEDEIQLGIQQGEGGRTPENPALMIHIVVLSRLADGSPWRKVWAAQVMTRGEEWVDVTLSHKTQNRLSVWAYPMPDGMIALDSAFWLKVPFQISTCASRVLRPGEPSEVFSLKTPETEYRVFQAVKPLAAISQKSVADL